MFAALELLEYGIKPLIFERGKRIEDRSVDMQRFIREGRWTLNQTSSLVRAAQVHTLTESCLPG